MSKNLVQQFKHEVISTIRHKKNIGIFENKQFLLDKNSSDQIVIYYGGYIFNIAEL